MENNFAQNNAPSSPRPWFKRPLFYTFIILIVILGYFGLRLGLAYTTISISNGGLWRGLTNVLDIKNNENATRAPDPNPIPKPEPNRLDVLILGIRGEDDLANGGLLTDTMMVLSVDKKTHNTALISIPRDLYLDMVTDAPNGKQIHLKGKINEVYPRALAYNAGLSLSKEIISKITGVYIDKAVVFDFNAFKTIVDNLGGVDIHLDKPFEEGTQWGYPFKLPAGDNHINGDQALYYVRSRFSTSDFDRARRQQQVIMAIKAKALSLGFLSNPVKVTSLFSDLKGDVRTDFQLWDIANLLTIANSVAKIKSYVMDTTNVLYDTKTESGEYILLPKNGNFEGIRGFFKNALLEK